MVTVQYWVPRGYRPEISRSRQLYAHVDDATALAKWVLDKFGVWITDNLTQDFTIHNVSSQRFEVQFEQAEHARAFMHTIGGSIQP